MQVKKTVVNVEVEVEVEKLLCSIADVPLSHPGCCALYDSFDDVECNETVFTFEVLQGDDDKTTFHCSEAK